MQLSLYPQASIILDANPYYLVSNILRYLSLDLWFNLCFKLCFDLSLDFGFDLAFHTLPATTTTIISTTITTAPIAASANWPRR